VARGAYLMNLGAVPYQEAWDLQRSLAAAMALRFAVLIFGGVYIVSSQRPRAGVDRGR
jgi:hypothetical protein